MVAQINNDVNATPCHICDNGFKRRQVAVDIGQQSDACHCDILFRACL